MDRAQAEAVADLRLASLLDVTDDVRRVEQAELAQPADRATLAVRGGDPAAEPGLVDPHPRLTEDVPTLDRILHRHRIAIVGRADHPSGCDEHAPRRRIVLDDEARV